MNSIDPRCSIVARSPCEARVAALRILFPAAMLTLVGVTRLLWLAHADVFPHVPMARFLAVSPVVDSACAGLILAGLVGALVAGLRRSTLGFQWATAVSLAALGCSIATDQQRFQPWAYHLGLGLLMLACGDARRAVMCLRVLVCGIYLHSALSKLDTAFLDQHGQYILSGFFQSIGVNLDDWLNPREPRWSSRRWVVGLMPVAEALIAVGLCWSRTRKSAVVLAIVTHVFLMLALGPWGLQHETGVLIWNAVFIVQAAVLFWPSRLLASPTDSKPRHWSHSQIAMACVTGFVSLIPFTRPLDWVDQWPAWAVYSPRSRELRITISAADRNSVGERIRPFVSAPDFQDRCSIRIDRMSLAELSVPIYPSTRIEVATALWLQMRGAESVQLHVKGDPLTMVEVHPDSKEFASFVSDLRLNIFPRP